MSAGLLTTEQARASLAVLDEVYEERKRQHARWGEQDHPDGTTPGQMFLGIFKGASMSTLRDLMRAQVDYDGPRGTCTYAGIFLEEVFEALAEQNPTDLRAELIQVAAVATAWVEAIDRREPQR